ncbi:MAG: hypothetical protein ABIU09_01435, partial [Pyrinomonadaceae bacterium]
HTYKTPIIHRNVRPENIKLNSDGRIKLMSFGLVSDDTHANVASGENASDGSSIAYSPLEQIWNGLDAASQKVITSHYDERSERVLKEDLDAKSDIYSVGATLYHLITARVPVDSLERSIEILEGRPDPLRPPHKIDPDIPREISDVIVKALEIKREYRFDSAAIMRQVLRTALVRVQEREIEEAREEEEAANDLKLAVQKKQQSAASEEISETERMKQQLQEAEEKRLLAEQRAAEAEKKLSESEAVQKARPEPGAAVPNFDDDLLGVLSPSVHISEAPKAKLPVNDASFADLADDAESKAGAVQDQPVRSDEVVESFSSPVEEEPYVENEIAEQETEEAVFSADEEFDEVLAESQEEISFSEDESVGDEPIVEEIGVAPHSAAKEETGSADEEPVEAIDDPVSKDVTAGAAVNADAATESAESDSGLPNFLDENYMVPVERSGFPLGMPVIGIGAAVLVVIAIGVWILTSSGTPEPAKIPTESPAATQTAPADTDVKSSFQTADVPAAQPTSEQADLTAIAPADPDPTTAKAVTASTPKPKKPVAAKTPTAKKAVTVEDLINDN